MQFIATCSDNNLSINVSKIIEIIVNYRKRHVEEHAPIHIKGTKVA